MEVHTYANVEETASGAARYVQQCARESVDARGRFAFALSGGRTPWSMLHRLSHIDIPWEHCDLFQVDERIAPHGAESRNLTHIQRHLVVAAPISESVVHPMPVEERDLQAGVDAYCETLAAVCGTPPVLDLVVLGLGADGHTASLVAGDPVLDIDASDVGVTTEPYEGTRRMTLTVPILNRARRILWLVTGPEKPGALKRLLDGDRTIPAGRIVRDRAVVFADEAAVPV